MYSVANFKIRQDRAQEREQALQSALVAFQDAFFATLERFAREATQTGLRGVRALTWVQNDGPCREASIQLNGWDLVIAIPSDVMLEEAQSRDDRWLAAKLFLYLTGFDGDHQTPHLEISIRENGTEQYQCEMSLLLPNSPRPILRGDFAVIGKPNNAEDRGKEAADALIRHFYNSYRVWSEPPTLGELRGKFLPTKPLGFATIQDGAT